MTESPRVVPYNSLGGVTLPELCVGIVGRDSYLDTEMLICVGATLCGCPDLWLLLLWAGTRPAPTWIIIRGETGTGYL